LYVLSVDSLTLNYWFYRNRKKERKFEWPCIHNMMPKCQVNLNCTANCKRKKDSCFKSFERRWLQSLGIVKR
jgi:hypothetical protein